MQTTRRRQVTAILCVFLICAAIPSSVTRLAAQSGAGPLDSILVKLDQIIAILTPPAVVMLATPPVQVSIEENGFCMLANVGTANLAVSVRIVNFFGTVLASETFPNVAPGRSVISQVPHQAQPADQARCEFTIQGTAAAVRANLLLIAADPSRTTLSVDAR